MRSRLHLVVEERLDAAEELHAVFLHDHRVRALADLEECLVGDAGQLGEVLLGHLRYGTQGKNDVQFCHPFIKKNTIPSRNLALAGNFNLVNTDELFGFDPITFQPTFFGNIIKPQTAQNYEAGIHFNEGAFSGKSVFYFTNVSNEIGFDNVQSANTNLDPTRHQGIETELSWQILTNLKAKASYTYDNAEFRSGVNRGNTLPSVPQNMAHAQLLWDTSSYGKYLVQLNYVGERGTIGDFTNTLDKLPSYTTLDLRANWELKLLTISLTALNLMDKRYAQSAIFSSSRNDYFYNPADGRTLFLSARYDFK